MTPFLVRFAQRLPDVPQHPLRYDSARQVSQILVNGAWVDAADAAEQELCSTRVTKMAPETTDDQ